MLYNFCLFIAYCDIADHLDCHQWILKEKARYGDKWKKQWAQERARRKVLAQLPAILAVNTHPVDTTVYLNWSHFLREFLTSGKGKEHSKYGINVAEASHCKR